MVIRKMNSMFSIHGRWMFAIITIVIIVAFVGFLTPGFASLFVKGGASGTAGEIFGKSISYEDLKDQTELDAIYISLAQNIDINNNQVFEYASNMAFPALCQYYAALQRGVVVSDKEIADHLRSLPRFAGKAGKFDMEKYDKFVSEMRDHGYDDDMIDKAVRHALVREKLMSQLNGEVLVTPDEVRLYYNDLHGKYSVSVAEFRASEYLKQIKLTDKDIDDFYKANKNNYMVSEQYKVRLVEFKYADFMAKAAKMVDTAQVEKYYKEHKTEFTSIKDKKSVTESLNMVRKQIVKKLADQYAKALASKTALRFAHAAYKSISEISEPAKIAPTFIEQASKSGKDVKNVGLINKDKPVVEPVVFAKIMDISTDIPISNPIPGKDASIVVLLEKKVEAVPAELKAVAVQVKNDLKHKKAVTYAREIAKNAHLKVTKSADKTALMKKLDKICKISQPDKFTVIQPPHGPFGRVIAALAGDTEVGKVSAVRNIPDGALFVTVEAKILPSEKEFEKAKVQTAYFYKMMKRNSIDMNFRMWLQSNSKRFQQQGN